MFSRRVTRSVTRAAAATTNNAPVAPPAPPAPAAAPNQTQTTVDNKPPPLRTRSGRVVRQIASTVQKLTGGRRGRKAAEQELVESQASTSTAPARPQTTAPPPRKRPRKDAPAASTSTNDAPVEAPATTSAVARKRAPKKQPAAKTRGRSNQGTAKASPSIPQPAPEAQRALADLPTVPLKAVEEYDALTSAIKEFNRTTLANNRIKRAPEPPYKSLLDIPRYKCVGPTFNLFDPAFRLVCGNRPFSHGVQEQPAVPGADSGYDTESEDGSPAGDGAGASAPSPTQTGTDDLNYNPVVLPIPERDEEAQLPTQHPLPGATLISRQNAYVFDRNGRPLPTGRGEPGIPEPIGDEVAALLKSWRGPPYPANWHGPMFEQELQLATPAKDVRPGLLTRQYAVNLGYPDDALEQAQEVEPTSSAGRPPRALLTRQDAVNLGYPDGVANPGPSSLARTSAATGTTAPTHQYGYMPAQEKPIPGLLYQDMYEPEAASAGDVQDADSVTASPNAPATVDPEEAARRQKHEMILKKYNVQPLRRQSHVFLEQQQRLQERGLLSPRHAEESEVFVSAPASPGPSTAPRPRPRPGCELKRQHAILIDEEGREVPIGAGDDTSEDGSLVPFGILVGSALQQMDRKKGTPADEPSQTQPQPQPRRSATPAAAAAASKLAALSRTSSQNSLGLLSSAPRGKPIPFSRHDSQASLGSKAPAVSRQSSLSSIGEAGPARVDKGKGRALPEPEPERQDVRVDMGRKRAREDEEEGSSETSEGDLDEVEASLVVDLEEDEADEDDAMADGDDGRAFPSGWPMNYVVHKGFFRIEVSTIPMPYLPVAPLPKNGEPVFQYVGPPGTQPPAILTGSSKRAREEDDVAEIAPLSKKARTAS